MDLHKSPSGHDSFSKQLATRHHPRNPPTTLTRTPLPNSPSQRSTRSQKQKKAMTVSATTAAIYVKHNNSRGEFVAKVDKQKLRLFSRHAARRCKSAPTRDRGCTEPNPFLVQQPAHLDVDIIPSLHIIVRGIEEYDEVNPSPPSITTIPTPTSPGTLGPSIGPDIKQAVDIYFTYFHIFVDRHRRGDLLHE
ncbi:hypothetical protein AC579_9110 [Pseudocercospora musae]|uniref:Uncharacterized protein n=1 Tax=Pseudocercospora musae TaxID=113226 RepID=A0A139IIZ6_9PEZI|nr:hypothetical protein AC579_9110 [Pseudocercospora musae]